MSLDDVLANRCAPISRTLINAIAEPKRSGLLEVLIGKELNIKEDGRYRAYKVNAVLLKPYRNG